MHPVLELGSWRWSTYGLCYALAVVVFGLAAFRRLARLGRPPAGLSRTLILAITATVAGSYLPAAVAALVQFARPGAPVPAGRPTILCGLALGLALAAWRCRRRGVPLARALDLGILPLPLALAVGRLGCLAAGCCGGRITPSPLSLYLPDQNGLWANRYPTQLLAIGADLVILGVLLACERQAGLSTRAAATRPARRDGRLFLLFAALFCAQRFAIQFLRADAVPVLGPFGAVHLYTAAGFAAAVALLAAAAIRQAVARPRPTSQGEQTWTS